MNNWYISSDHHFDHIRCHSEFEPSRMAYAKILGYDDVDQMLVDEWNKVVDKDDFVLYLGDFTINKMDIEKTRYNIEKFTRLCNGYKFLLNGNHDKDIDFYREVGWVIIDKNKPLGGRYHYLIVDGKYSGRYFLCHVPFIDMKRRDLSRYVLNDVNKDLYEVFTKEKCDISIHGHMHSKVSDEKICVNVCVELTEFEPIPVPYLRLDILEQMLL